MHGSYNSYIYPHRIAQTHHQLSPLPPLSPTHTHLIKVRDKINIYKIDDREILDFLRDRPERLVHFHTCPITVGAEAEADYTVVFGENGLVDVPA